MESNTRLPQHIIQRGQSEIFNQEIKRILEKVVSPSLKGWSFKLDSTLWA